MSIRWFDAFVILLFGVDNLKAKLFVELNGAIVVDLHVPVLREVDLHYIYSLQRGSVEYLQKDAVEISILFGIVEDVLEHDGTNA